MIQDVNISKDGQPTALCWHPHKKVLVVGWEAGYLQVWTDTDKTCFEVNQQHFSEITTLHWTGNGSRLVSCDAVCILATTVKGANIVDETCSVIRLQMSVQDHLLKIWFHMFWFFLLQCTKSQVGLKASGLTTKYATVEPVLSCICLGQHLGFYGSSTLT